MAKKEGHVSYRDVLVDDYFAAELGETLGIPARYVSAALSGEPISKASGIAAWVEAKFDEPSTRVQALLGWARKRNSGIYRADEVQRQMRESEREVTT